MKLEALIGVVALAFATLACSITINVPEIKTGPTQTFTVDAPLLPGDQIAEVDIKMGAGTFNLTGGASRLIEGTIRYNVAEWEPSLSTIGNHVTLEQGPIKGISGIPGGNVINEWNLKLNNDAIMDLSITAGAYKGNLELGGLHLRNLSISDGASKSEVTFDRPNPVDMDELTYKTGASQVSLSGLANANFNHMSFEGGAGSYTLNFSGTLKRTADVTIKTGVSSVTLIVPAGMNARITNTGGLSNISTQGTWTVTDNTYSSSGQGPLLTISVEMGVGSLTLKQQ